MKSKSGFTIIEVVVVITVIAILSALAVLTFNTVQMDTRDAKRKADIETLVTLFEAYYDKNGEYPTGCSKYNEANKLHCTFVYPSYNNHRVTTNPDALYADTTLSRLQEVFPSIPNSFGNPSRPNDPPLKGYISTDSTPGYYYRGEIRNIGATQVGSTTMSATNSNEIDCGSGVNIYHTTAGAVSGGTAFILGYWSESKGQWFIYQGKRGVELTRNVTTVPVRGATYGKCVFVQ